MKKFLISLIATLAIVIPTYAGTILGGGTGTLNQLDQWRATSTPVSAITQNVANKPIKITGLSSGDCLTLDADSLLATTTCGSPLTPWTSDIDGDGFSLTDVLNITASGDITALTGGVYADRLWADNSLSLKSIAASPGTLGGYTALWAKTSDKRLYFLDADSVDQKLAYFSELPDLSPYFKADGSVTGTGNWTIGSFDLTAGSVTVNNVKAMDTSVVLDTTLRQLPNSSSAILADYAGSAIYFPQGINDSSNTLAIDPNTRSLNQGGSVATWDSTGFNAATLRTDSIRTTGDDIILDLPSTMFYDWGGGMLAWNWGTRIHYASDGVTPMLNLYTANASKFTGNVSITTAGTLAPVSKLHIDAGTATASDLRFTLGTTVGQTATDGFQIGVTTTGLAEIRQREALALQFFTSNTNYMSLAAAAPTLTLDSQASNSANAGAVVYRTASGSESFTSLFNAADNNFYFSYGATTIGSLTSTGWGFGVTAFDNAATVDIRSTTEQLRVGYDASNYWNASTTSTGITTFNGVGSGASFTFAKKVFVSNPVNLKGYTVATLPTGVTGDVAYVTDALAPAFLVTVAGGGAVVTPVFYNGTNWVAQ